MMSKSVYLDYNIFAYYLDSSSYSKLDVKSVIDEIFDCFRFPYSPAHMEEIAVPLAQAYESNDEGEIKKASELAFLKLENVSKISSCLEHLPSEDGPMRVEYEDPRACLFRVVRDYSLNSSLEGQESRFLTLVKQFDPDGRLSNIVSNIGSGILSEEKYNDGLMELLAQDDELKRILEVSYSEADFSMLNWDLMKDSFDMVERVLELSFNFLEYIRYKPEKVCKSRSRMHDVTHAIYATASDFFVTGDEKFKAKVEAIYQYFEIPVQVISLLDIELLGKIGSE